MGSISGRQFNQIIGNLEKIIAIELMYGAQALEFRRPNTFSSVVEDNFAIIRKKVTKLEDDRVLKDDINALIKMVRNQEFIVN
jgi:histidine ammonia-lyase